MRRTWVSLVRLRLLERTGSDWPTYLDRAYLASVLSPYGNPPLTNRQAWEAYQSILGDDRIVFRPEEPAGLEAHWRRFARRGTIVTGDGDLLAHGKYQGVAILTPRQFIERLARGR